MSDNPLITTTSALAGFLSNLEMLGELRVVAGVSRNLDAAGLTRRICQEPYGGPALLFREPSPAEGFLITNLLGSLRRQELGMGLAAGSIASLEQRFLPLITSRGLQLPNELAPLTAVRPTALEPRTRFSLFDLPTLVNWPYDGSAAGSGHYITLGNVHTIDPETSAANCGIYRCQIHGPQSMAIRWKRGSGAEQHFQRYRALQKPMPISITMGVPPALTLCAAWPVPDTIDEIHLAGWLQGRPVERYPCSHGPILVPSDSEVVLEGFVDLHEELPEGPFGNFRGSYDPSGAAAKITITAWYQRTPFYMPATVVGPPPQEDCLMMRGWERFLAATLAGCIEGFYDISLPAAWVFNKGIVLALKEPTAQRAKDAIQKLWDTAWFKDARIILVVDSSVNIHDNQILLWQMAQGTGLWGSRLLVHADGMRLGIDATETRVSLQETITTTKRLANWQKEFCSNDRDLS